MSLCRVTCVMNQLWSRKGAASPLVPRDTMHYMVSSLTRSRATLSFSVQEAVWVCYVLVACVRVRVHMYVHMCVQASLQANAPNVMATPFNCDQCQRKLRRSGDLKRHKCVSRGRQKGNAEPTQVQCQMYSRVFRRQGDMKRHKYRTVKWKHFLSTHPTHKWDSIVTFDSCIQSSRFKVCS